MKKQRDFYELWLFYHKFAVSTDTLNNNDMKKNKIITAAFATMLGMTALCGKANAQETTLPSPTQSNVAGSLTKALQDRHSTRTFSDTTLSDQTLADLLWAADGVNRKDGKRTAPSAMNRQDVTIYVGKADGTFRYDAATNKLVKIGGGDLRKAAADRNKFIATAPVVLVIASDTGLTGGNMGISGLNVGAVMQNVYLYCAANGLATVCCYAGDAPKDMQKFLGIKESIMPLVYMPVGY